MVLGNELRNILVRLLEILNSARSNVQGVPLPLVGGADITNSRTGIKRFKSTEWWWIF